MVSANDVAAFLVREVQPISALKLQKLLYYSQAWHLVWEERPLFSSRIKAWVRGPVLPSIWRQKQGSRWLHDWPTGDPQALSEKHRATVREVIRVYAPWDSEILSELTHCEAPWREARENHDPCARVSPVISHESMVRYYGFVSKPGDWHIPAAYINGASVLLALDEDLALVPNEPCERFESVDTWLASIGEAG